MGKGCREAGTSLPRCQSCRIRPLLWGQAGGTRGHLHPSPCRAHTGVCAELVAADGLRQAETRISLRAGAQSPARPCQGQHPAGRMDNYLLISSSVSPGKAAAPRIDGVTPVHPWGLGAIRCCAQHPRVPCLGLGAGGAPCRDALPATRHNGDGCLGGQRDRQPVPPRADPNPRGKSELSSCQIHLWGWKWSAGVTGH